MPSSEEMNEDSSRLVSEYLKTITEQISAKGRKFKITNQCFNIESALNDKFEERTANVYVIVIINEGQLGGAQTDRSFDGANPQQQLTNLTNINRQ
jgi:hypothetical protein